MSSPPALHGIALQLVMQMLLPEDVAHAEMTCKTWNEDLKPRSETTEDSTEEAAAAPANSSSGPEDATASTSPKSNDSTFVWKQAAKNLEPGFAQAVLDVAESQGTTLDVHRLAAGLTSHRKRKHPEPLELPEPKFRIEDLTIIVEVKRKIVTKDDKGQDVTRLEPLGILTCNDCSSLLRGEAVSIPVPEARGFLLEGANPLHPDNPRSSASIANMRHFFDIMVGSEDLKLLWEILFGSIGTAAMRDLVTRPFLLRRDDWRTFSPLLLDGFSRSPIDGHKYCHNEEQEVFAQFKSTDAAEVEVLVASFPDGFSAEWDSSTSFASVKSRAIAEEAMGDCFGDRGLNRLCSFSNCEMVAVPSDGEPIWQRKTREFTETRSVTWTAQDTEELRSASKFQFRLKTLDIRLKVFSPGSDDLKPLNGKNLLLTLDSLDWK